MAEDQIVTRSKSRLVNVNQMALGSRVVIQRNYDLDQQALLMERPRPTRRASTHANVTPRNNRTQSTDAPKSAPNTPKSVKSILKASKSKPFTLVGPKRPTLPPKNSILNYLVPVSSQASAIVPPPSILSPPSSSQSSSAQPSPAQSDVGRDSEESSTPGLSSMASSSPQPSSSHPSPAQSDVHQDLEESDTSGPSSMASILLPPTPAPETDEERHIINIDESTIPDDEFSSDILQLNENDQMYQSDEDDI